MEVRTRQWTYEQRQQCRRSSLPGVVKTTLDLIWESFGDSEFSSADFRDELGGHRDNTSGVKLTPLQTLVYNGFLEKIGDRTFRLTETQVLCRR
jgi:hypothetical protein